MKKILFIVVMIFICSVSYAQNLTDNELNYLKICVEKGKVPYIGYPTGNDFVFSVEKNDYIAFKATMEEHSYYKQLNKVYKKYNTAVNKYDCSYDDIMNNSLNYKKVTLDNKSRNEMIAGCILVGVGTGIIAYNSIHWSTKALNDYKHFDSDNFETSTKITYALGGIMEIVGVCLIVDAVHTKHQSLRLGVTNLSYTYKF